MIPANIVGHDEWIEARKALLEKEKAFTRERDALAKARQSMPWVRVDKDYRFQTEEGEKSLGDLFEGYSQLVIFHFMYGPDWDAGCKSCSFWADNFNGIGAHLRQRDTRLVAVSRAPLRTLLAFRDRMGWQFPWVSSEGSDFNYDFHVSFHREDVENNRTEYNYRIQPFPSEEAPGLSCFIKGDDGGIYHTYSAYSRGLDIINAAYNILDMTAMGRHEGDLPYTMAWVKLHDEY